MDHAKIRAAAQETAKMFGRTHASIAAIEKIEFLIEFSSRSKMQPSEFAKMIAEKILFIRDSKPEALHKFAQIITHIQNQKKPKKRT